jgi:hypothetical protein
MLAIASFHGLGHTQHRSKVRTCQLFVPSRVDWQIALSFSDGQVAPSFLIRFPESLLPYSSNHVLRKERPNMSKERLLQTRKEQRLKGGMTKQGIEWFSRDIRTSNE